MGMGSQGQAVRQSPHSGISDPTGSLASDFLDQSSSEVKLRPTGRWSGYSNLKRHTTSPTKAIA